MTNEETGIPGSGQSDDARDQLRKQMAPYLEQILAKGFDAGVVTAATHLTQVAADLGRKDRKIGKMLNALAQQLVQGRNELAAEYMKQMKSS